MSELFDKGPLNDLLRDLRSGRARQWAEASLPFSGWRRQMFTAGLGLLGLLVAAQIALRAIEGPRNAAMLTPALLAVWGALLAAFFLFERRAAIEGLAHEDETVAPDEMPLGDRATDLADRLGNIETIITSKRRGTDSPARNSTEEGQ